MTFAPAPRSVWMRLAGLVLAMPFVLLSLVAQGYMPARGDDGALRIVICTGQGPVAMVLDPETGRLKPAPEVVDGRCSWAQAALALTVPEAPVLRVPLRLAQAFHPVAPDDLWRPAYDPLGIWARGPPRAV